MTGKPNKQHLSAENTFYIQCFEVKMVLTRMNRRTVATELCRQSEMRPYGDVDA